MPSCRTAVIRRSKAAAEVRRIPLRSSQDQDAPTLRLLTGDELKSSAHLARCRRNRSRSRQEHPAAAHLCRPSCFECQGMRAKGSQPRRHLPAVRPSPQEGRPTGGSTASGGRMLARLTSTAHGWVWIRYVMTCRALAANHMRIPAIRDGSRSSIRDRRRPTRELQVDSSLPILIISSVSS
jgi:hypothetical protein